MKSIYKEDEGQKSLVLVRDEYSLVGWIEFTN